MAALADDNLITRVDIQHHMAITAYLQGVIYVIWREYQLYLAIGVDNDRAAAQGVGKHGHQRDGIELWREDGPSCREGVGGRAGGGGDYDAIGALAIHENIINMHSKINHMGYFARV